MLSSNLPAWPTNGSPCRSSFSPGASPTISQSGWVSPTPKTVLRRPSHSLQARQFATASARASHCMASTGSAERNATCRATGAGTGATLATAATGAGFPPAARGSSGAVSSPRSIGAKSLTPISSSIARRRSSSSRLIDAPSQLQAHHDGILAASMASGVVALALAHVPIAVALVNPQRARIARANLQPQPLRALALRPQRQRLQHETAPALPLVRRRDGDVQQVHLVHALHGDEIAQHHAAGMQQLRLIAGVQRIAEIAARPGVLIGQLLDRDHFVQARFGKRLELRFDGLENGAHDGFKRAAWAARSSVVWA